MDVFSSEKGGWGRAAADDASGGLSTCKTIKIFDDLFVLHPCANKNSGPTLSSRTAVGGGTGPCPEPSVQGNDTHFLLRRSVAAAAAGTGQQTCTGTCLQTTLGTQRVTV